MHEHHFKCPYCLAKISMILDLSAETQKYIEDCETCCNPIEISFEVEDDKVVDFYARTLEE